MPSNQLPSAFTLLAKPTGAACNLACEYCFYLEKDQLYQGSSFRMTNAVLEAYLRQYLRSQAAPEVTIAWQGGEPTLMGLDFFERSIELAKAYKKPGQKLSFTLQTNGTLLDDEWCAFFKKNHFLVGLSLDGTGSMHDAYRLNKGRTGSFDKVMHAWELLQKYRVATNILCAVHAANASHPLQLYRFFRETLGVKFIQFIPIVERLEPGSQQKTGADYLGKAPVSSHSVQPTQFGEFLVEVFDEWVHHDVGKVFIQTFEAALASWCRLPASVCVFQEVCGLSLVLEHTGDLYACDHFVEPGHRLGNILERPLVELASLPVQRRFGMDKRDRLPAYCRQCDVLFACRGECPRNRFVLAPDDSEEGLNFLCDGYQQFFHHIDQPMRSLASLLRAGRAPAEIMQLDSSHKTW